MKEIQYKPIKGLGQHFITNSNITDKIVLHANHIANCVVMEIGGGYGMLTQSIMKIGKPKFLICLEKDSNLIPHLSKVASLYNNINVIHGDALKIDERSIMHEVLPEYIEEKITIIGNLPYNIATALIWKWLKIANTFKSFTILIQKEVGALICQENKTCNNFLSFVINTLCRTEILLELSPDVFSPPPKVQSSLIYMEPIPNVKYDYESLIKFGKILFHNRRKSIRNVLKSLHNYDILMHSLSVKGIDLSKRAESMTRIELLSIFEELNHS
ncbi:16S rRNA (adenine(1518)-N(6)/adenine(1519)-N(6))-dimethyltransferase RsmA [Candidatus Fokinia crypta]|uniref:Ribosomal RNA small subunit methyltransferase A n=1 Tax=Candidatus Fokinia crypta TaxID=1920990 RepID=A0ABZ0UNG9_9RICK|nr:16S rRNA (adenine(1518)-N(6)/adenine(1519)-N(6))-dimethyltransferase RsmA [Candidatus Fokinia cryptica]WPX97675.1 Ribosomal RNA small subunit methyltransferase A [Candidatus Fokinia cryptica]